MKYTYVTGLDIDSCKKRFNELLKNEVSNGVEGNIYNSRHFWIEKRSLKFQNSFQRSFCGEFNSLNDKTIITAKFTIGISVKILMAYFNMFLLIVEGIMFSDLLKRIKNNDSIMIKQDILCLFIPIGMLGLIYFMYHVMPKLNSKEEKYIEKILIGKLKAKKLDT